jgi:hypothetical protein
MNLFLTFLVFFLVKGRVSYVAPRYDNKEFCRFEPGDQFGLDDLANFMHIFENQDDIISL